MLTFPRDHGAHPDYRTEWWYITGIVRPTDHPDAQDMGFQVTFFRSRLDTDPTNPSRFAARQLLFAHAAVSDPARGHLLSEQRAARAGFGLAEASTEDMAVHIGPWSLVRDARSQHFRIKLVAERFSLALELSPTKAILLEGEAGFSQKGPSSVDASEYYSIPQLAVLGSVTLEGRAAQVAGLAWMDREWSSSYLAPDAIGWDWAGINLDDGGALMAFRIRKKSGEPLWAGGTLRQADGTQTRFAPSEVAFKTARTWRSPRTGVVYPVGQTLSVGPYSWQLAALMDDQELDTSASTGTLYWEGAVRASPVPGSPPGLRSGEGYLELTGYDQPLKL